MDAKQSGFRRYDAEFRRNAVELSRSNGRTVRQTAEELGIPFKTLERWRYQIGKRSGGAMSAVAQDAEVRRLRKELTDVQMERDILKKALAICSRQPSPNVDSK